MTSYLSINAPRFVQANMETPHKPVQVVTFISPERFAGVTRVHVDSQGFRWRVVLLIGNESELERFREMLTGSVFDIECFKSVADAERWMQSAKFRSAVLVLSDTASNGLSIASQIGVLHATFPGVLIVLSTASRSLAVDAFNAGAFAVVREPAGANVFCGTLLRAWQNAPLRYSGQ